MSILVTGNAGFIGFHLTKALLKQKQSVIGLDNLNNYYDQKLKLLRLEILKKFSSKNNYKYKFIKGDINNLKLLNSCFKKHKISLVIHLAAQAGVRYSIKHPLTYVKNNINGFFNVLEVCRLYKVKHLVYASTSSVYGLKKKFPVKETDNTDKPLSFYAATKKSNEVMAHSYSNIYGLRATGIRFFTVYGPYGRPDMALYKFVEAIVKSKQIELFNKGNHIRDFTYIDDVTSSLIKILRKPPKGKIPHSIFNVGGSNPKHLKLFLKIIISVLGKKPKIKFKGLQKGDVKKTHASNINLSKKIGFNSKTNLKQGIKKFIDWYIQYKKIKFY